MPLIEITNAHLLRAPLPYYYPVKHSKISFVSVNNDAWNWNSFRIHQFNLARPRFPFLIKAVAATAEPKSEIPAALNPHHHQPGPGPLDEKEKLRRSRISQANKGIIPWNKGRKHTPETLQKIKERTRIAMKNPKVRMKLVKIGHLQTTQTKLKIGATVRELWKKKRRIKMVQESCHFHWQNLIAQASKQGFLGQEELQWNSYQTFDAKLKVEVVERRKRMTRAPSNRRAPKSPEQRQKIAQSISAKWADPEYRERVVSSIVKYHLSTERIPRPRPTYTRAQPAKKKPITKKSYDNPILVKPIKLRKRKPPAYKDPLVNSKLEMIKNIRAQRASVDTRQTQAIQQARLLIAEAEKAAKALEVAAEKSPIAQASLIETRKLITEAIQSLESIDTQKTDDGNVPSVSLSEEVNKENESTFEIGNHSQMVHVNGHKTLSASVYKFSEDFGFLSLERPVNGDPELHLTDGCAFLPFSLNSQINQYSPSNQERETEQYESSKNNTDDSLGKDETLSRSESPAEDETLSSSETETDDSPAEDETLSRSDSPAEDETLSKSDSPVEDETLSKSDSPAEDETQSRSAIATKKWVRGRLVDVSEEPQ